MVISSDLKRQWLDMTTAVGLARDFVARFNEPGYCPFAAAALHKSGGGYAVPVAVTDQQAAAAKREAKLKAKRESAKRCFAKASPEKREAIRQKKRESNKKFYAEASPEKRLEMLEKKRVAYAAKRAAKAA